MIAFRAIIVCFLIGCLSYTASGQSSVLHSGTWHKVSVERAGVYRISYDMLRKMGINPSQIDPRHIRLYGRPGGMLPQLNSTPRERDLRELHIRVVGEDDGRFDRNDYILFYGEGPDHFHLNTEHQIFYYENNLYSERNFYFLTVGDSPGKRIEKKENLEGIYPVIRTYDDFSYYEQDRHNLNRSGREWFGEQFGSINVYTLTYDLPGIVDDSPVTIVSDVLGQSYSEAAFRISLNGVPVGEQKVGAIPGGRYSIVGLHRRDTFRINATQTLAPGRSSQELKIEFLKAAGFSQGYLDFILLNIQRKLALYGDQTIFRSGESLKHAVSTFEIAHTGDVVIWDVTDHYQTFEQVFTTQGSTATFSTPTDELRQWVIFNNKIPEPDYMGPVPNQNLAGASTPNLLIVAHSDFVAEAERLAQHRTSHSGWSALVATPEQIFNEFSGGRQDVTAIRDYAKFLNDKTPATLKAILLFGKGSYDYKDRIVNNTNFVPTYQSRNSLDPLRTYASDDFFGFLEDHEGEWNESPAEHHTLDVGVGRLPVTTAEQARNIVDKIIHYDKNKDYFGSWRKTAVFVADDGNSVDGFTSLHQRQADQIANFIEESDSTLDTRRLFMGTYKKVVQPNGETTPELANDVKRIFDLGALVINFTGHGSERVWADERILTDETVKSLRNKRYPFLVTATCEFGRQDDPLLVSTAELSVTQSPGGSIGLVTTARPVNATTNFSLNQAFYNALLQRDGNGYKSIGEVFMLTKNNSEVGVSNRNFSLIGDPSMVLAIPQQSIAVTEVKTSNGSDTLRAFSRVIIRGEVMDAASRDILFNGVVEASLYDQRKSFTTIGRNNPPFTFDQWHNAVFRGRASVVEGAFELSFIMPRNIANDFDFGRLSLYAFDEARSREAKGAAMSFRIGGVEKDFYSDTTPPAIRLFIGDTTFVNGGITTSDTDLIAILEDESGINISGTDDAYGIQAQLDDGEPFNLNDYYVSDIDTYQKGMVRYPLIGLTPGPHTLTFHAADVFNNVSKTSIQFVVTDNNNLVIESFGNYPNPVRDRTTLFFTHNRSGDDLKAQIFIFSIEGALVRESEVAIPNSEYHIDLLNLDTRDEAEKKLLPGIYLARLIVRSMTNGSKNEKVTKLIILN